MVQGYGRTHGSDARERRQCGSGGATAAHRGESSRRDDGEAARRPFHAGPVPNQRCHCQDTTRAQQGRLLADGRRREPDYKVRIVDAVLFVRKAVLSPTVAMAHIRALEKGTAKY